MKRLCMCTLLSVLLVSWCCLCMGCASTPKTVTVTETKIETITETEYVPVYVDLNDTIKFVIEQRPDNSKMTVKANAKNTFDILVNSWSYQSAWLNWQSYAELLEKTLYTCRDMCKDPNSETEDVVIENTTTTPQTEIEKSDTSITTPNGNNFELLV